HAAKLLHHAPGKTANAEFQSLQVVDGVDLLAKPATHLTRRVAGEQRRDVVALIELVEQFLAAAHHVPGLIEPRVGAERNTGAEGEGRILAEVIVRRGVSHLDGAVLHGIEYLQAGHDFARRKRLTLKL